MTVQEWLQKAEKTLKQAGVSTPRLDSLVLLEDELNFGRSSLLANSERVVKRTQLTRLNKKLERRKKHEPLAYIRGKSEFYGREFIVNQNTLQPRPETETLVELTIEFVKSVRKTNENNGLRIIDVGTGSGCIAISLDLELKDHAEIFATDIDTNCLTTAKKNAKNLKAEVNFYQGNLIEPLLTDKKFCKSSASTIIVANLPYVPSKNKINEAAMFEPQTAIFGGADGLKYYREMFDQISTMQDKPLAVITESLPPQHRNLAKLAKQQGYHLKKTQDLIQVFVI
jgi:release factor glutamine methyltransferase